MKKLLPVLFCLSAFLASSSCIIVDDGTPGACVDTIGGICYDDDTYSSCLLDFPLGDFYERQSCTTVAGYGACVDELYDVCFNGYSLRACALEFGSYISFSSGKTCSQIGYGVPPSKGACIDTYYDVCFNGYTADACSYDVGPYDSFRSGKTCSELGYGKPTTGACIDKTLNECYNYYTSSECYAEFYNSGFHGGENCRSLGYTLYCRNIPNCYCYWDDPDLYYCL